MTELAINAVVRPPPFDPSSSANLPPPVPRTPKSFRELYLDAIPFLDAEEAIASPFYAVHHLFRINRRCWSDVISAIRDEDQRIHGISEASVSHIEDIRRSFDIVTRGGSLGWPNHPTPIAAESKTLLVEDFTHLLKQAGFLWDSREKMAAVQRRRSEARWNALTNSFTFVYGALSVPFRRVHPLMAPDRFVPVTVISGIYGMNVSEINGSIPDLWQVFVATAAVDVIIVFALAMSNWLHIASRQGRTAGVKEIFSFALGRSVDGLI